MQRIGVRYGVLTNLPHLGPRLCPTCTTPAALAGDVPLLQGNQMKTILFVMSFGIGAMFLAANHVNAQTQNCADHARVVERLATAYGESRQSIGLDSNNAVVEVFASMDTGSWTITVTQPGGPTCLVAAGQAYQYLNEPLANFDIGL